MFKKIVAAAVFVSAISAGLGVAMSASAGEGHWSIGKGVQCKIVSGVVVCSKTRP